MVKQPTSYRETLGSYPSPKLMILSCKSYVLAKTCTVDDHSDFRHVITWIGKRITHKNFRRLINPPKGFITAKIGLSSRSTL